jgi:hypothetical protein
VIDYPVARMEQALRDRMRQRKQQLEAGLARLVNPIAEGQPSQAFMAAIGKRERELQTISDRLLKRSFAMVSSSKCGITGRP